MKTLLCILLASVCCLQASAEEIGGVSYKLDMTKWKVADSYENSQQKMITYIPEGESSEGWNEQFTVQAIKGLNKTPEQFYALFLEQLKILAPEKNVQSQVNNQAKNELFAEWWIDQKIPEDQHEWIRLIQNKDAVIIMRYTTKKMDQIEAARKTADMLLRPSLPALEGSNQGLKSS